MDVAIVLFTRDLRVHDNPVRFGCLSAVELARNTRARPGGEEFCRQLAWRTSSTR